MKPNFLADIELFNEKASLLQKSSFAEKMFNNQSAFMFSYREGEYAESILVGAEGESVDAVFLTLRMFMQNNDRISIGNIAKIYAEIPDITHLKQKFDILKGQLNDYLDTKIEIEFFGRTYTNREAIELLLYGSKAHSHPKKEAELNKLRNNGIVENLFLHIVNIAVANFIKHIIAISEINQNTLNKLKNF